MTRVLLLRLARDTRGLAFIEFAFAAPIFLMLILGGLELTNLAVAHLRVSQMAMTVADDAGRMPGPMNESDIYEVFAGAEVIGGSIDFEDNGRVVLSSLEHNGLTGSDEGQTIHWQRCWGELDVEPAYGAEGAGSTDASLAGGMGEAGNRLSSQPGTAVMFVEVTYAYQPLVSTGFFRSPTIRYESAFNVRGRQSQAINGRDMPALTC